ncbi:low molecular weight phosphotyrosine protein phosphatase [Luteolibacter yonseiensis]|uniref:Low molecular weight phosphotyrosine protein phosphatase n=1 Tax=Luteolibacter yonseiensis TaxID=1144680 RepID=A0A934QWU5_9BACT|nr:low molecular weight protein-tyrosine-phosphatase [Luteolibacter yonseiensis]MBK1814188.1 low molecular weight phosphotyrosine protein phosphatase [Luteolibacter yonseiensis]
MQPPLISPRRVLFVCLGNICRSPAAEIIFRQQVEDAGLSGEFEIDSAGTISHHEGSPPDSRMSETLLRKGYTVSGQARRISAQDLEKFDLIVTMDESNHTDVMGIDHTGAHHGKIRTLVSFCREHDDLRVPDPYYGGQIGFNHVISLLEDGCAGILDSLKSK